MSRIHLKSHSLALWLSLAVAAAGAVGVGCSSSSDSDDSAASAGGPSAGKTGVAGKSGASGGDGSVPSEGGAAGTITDTPAGGDTSSRPPPASGDAGSGGSEPGTDITSDAGAGAGGTAPVTPDPTAAAIARAKQMIAGLSMPCSMCHQPNYAGANYWPNITPDEETGIGTWSDDDIKKAITQGIGVDDHVFCAEMQHFKWTDSQLSDVVIFLRNLKPVTKKISKVCTTK